MSFASAAPGQWFKRRDCESLVCPSDWDIVPLINGAVGGFLDWLLSGDPPGLGVGKPTTATPTQSEPDTELRVWAPPSKECNVVVPDRKSQTVSTLRPILNNRKHDADRSVCGVFLEGSRDLRILIHAKRV